MRDDIVDRKMIMLAMIQKSKRGEKYNMVAARRAYKAEYPDESPPSRQSFTRVLKTYEEHGRVDPPRKPRKKTKRDGPVRREVERRIAHEPNQSLRRLAQDIGAKRETVRQIAKEITALQKFKVKRELCSESKK